MEAFSFVFKTTILTIAVVLILQIKWQHRTLEDYAMQALTSATVVGPINDTAHGAVIFARTAWDRFIRSFHSEPGFRHFMPSELTHRSQASLSDATRAASAR